MDINFTLTDEQVKIMCEAAGKKASEMEEYQICELLDRVIDEFVLRNS